MPIEKINFSYPKGTLQSVFDTQEMTALELAAKTSKKVDECVDLVNGVEQSAIEATAVVDEMRISQEQFMTENNDIRAQLVVDNQAFIDGLEASKTTFETTMTNDLNAFKDSVNASKTTFETTMTNDLNTFKDSVNASKTTFETDMTNAVNTVIANADTTITNEVNTKINGLINDGTIENLINETVTHEVTQAELSLNEATGNGVIEGLTVLAQASPNMSVLVTPGIAHLYNGKRYKLLETANVAIDAPDALYDRIDIIYISSAGVLTYGKGQAQAVPVAPTPVNGLTLAEIYVAKTALTIVTANITDKRPIKTQLPGLKEKVDTIDNSVMSLKAESAKVYISVTNPPSPLVAAVGDGVTDDTAAIQAILNLGGRIFLPVPSVKYLVTAPLIVPDTVVEIVGLKSHIFYDYEQSVTPSYLESLFVVNNVDNLTMKDLKLEYGGTFDTGSSYGGYISGIHVERSDNFKAIGIEAFNFNRAGINIATSEDYTDYCNNPKIIGCYLHNNRVGGVLFGNTDHIEISGCKLTYNGLVTDNGTGYGSAGWSAKYPKNSNIHDNYASFNYRKGIDFHSVYNATIHHNICEGNRLYGIFVDNKNLTDMGSIIIDHNKILNMSYDGAFPTSSMYGILVGNGGGEGTSIGKSLIIVDSNDILNFTQTGTGIAVPFMLNVHGLSRGDVKISNNKVKADVVTRFLITDSTSDNVGNYFDLEITGNEFFANTITHGISILSGNNRVTKFDGNTIEVITAYTQANIVVYANTTIPNNMHTFNNNVLLVTHSTSWTYDPFQIKRTTKELAKNNMLNGVPLRDWDGYRFIGRGTAAPTTNYWSVGSEQIKTNSVEEGTAGSKYILDKWKCTVAGEPGTWLEIRGFTGN